MEIKPKVREEAVQINDIPWKPFPDALSRRRHPMEDAPRFPKWARGPRF